MTTANPTRVGAICGAPYATLGQQLVWVRRPATAGEITPGGYVWELRLGATASLPEPMDISVRVDLVMDDATQVLATRLAETKEYCPECQGYDASLRSNGLTHDPEVPSRELCTKCDAQGYAYVFPDAVRVPCLVGHQKADQGFYAPFITCAEAGCCGWTASVDMPTWIKAAWQVFPSKLIIFTPPGLGVPNFGAGQIVAVGDDPFGNFLRTLEIAVEAMA